MTTLQFWKVGAMDNPEEGRHSRIRSLLPWLIVLVGTVLRLVQYASNRSLWLDESALALNIVNRSFTGLLWPMDYGQSAPVAFLLVERLILQVLGNSEYALRLFPLLCGVFSLFLFRHLAPQILAPGAVPIALCLFALSEPLIYYSAELKQYSSDVAVALLIYVSAVKAERGELKVAQLVQLAVAGAVGLWFSLPAVFVLAGVGLALALGRWANREWHGLLRILLVGAFWLLSLFVNYLLVVRSFMATGYLHMASFHAPHFMPFPPLSMQGIHWFITHITGMFDERWFVYGSLGGVDEPVGVVLPGVWALTGLIGCASAACQKKRGHLLVALPVLMTLVGSGFRLYPFWSRFLLFALPTIFIFMAEGIRHVRYRVAGRAPLIVLLLLTLVFLHPVLSAIHRCRVPRTREEIRPVVQHVSEEWRVRDTVYVYYGARPAFEYYSQTLGFAVKPIWGVTSRNDWAAYTADLDKIRGEQRVWIVFSHVWSWAGVDEQKFFLYYLDAIGQRSQSLEAAGASAYLYDLSQ